MYVSGIQARVWAETKECQCPALCFLPLRLDFSLNLELGWQPSDPASLLLSLLASSGEAKGMWPCLDFYVAAGDLN